MGISWTRFCSLTMLKDVHKMRFALDTTDTLPFLNGIRLTTFATQNCFEPKNGWRHRGHIELSQEARAIRSKTTIVLQQKVRNEKFWHLHPVLDTDEVKRRTKTMKQYEADFSLNRKQKDLFCYVICVRYKKYWSIFFFQILLVFGL